MKRSHFIALVLIGVFIASYAYLQAAPQRQNPQPAQHATPHPVPHPAQHAAPRPARAVARTPSMSRVQRQPIHAQAQPARPAAQPAGGRAIQPRTYPKPSQAQIEQFAQRKAGSINPQVTRGAAQEQIKQHLQQTKSQDFNKRPVDQQKAQSIKSQLSGRKGVGHGAGNTMRDQVRRQYPDSRNWFNKQFFDSHNFRPRYYGANGNWWGGAGWGGVAAWLPWGWNAPVYYDDYGDAVTLPSDGGSYDYAPENAPAAPAQGDWLPLGVFAVGQDLGEAQDSDLFMQLALSKEGEISGTYYNASTDDTHPIEGSVDSGTQEAAWKISDDPYSPIMTTGLYNLTQDTATIQVYFSDAPQQTWFLARVNE